MQQLILIGAGVAALIAPMLCLLVAVGIWAIVRKQWLRRVLLTMILVVAAWHPLKVAYGLYTGSNDQQQFARYCQQHPSGEIFAKARNAKTVIANYNRYNRQPDAATIVGKLAFPFYMANRMLLNGVETFESVAIRAKSGHELMVAGNDRAQRFHQEPPKIRFAYGWEDNSISSHDRIASASLVIKDLETEKILAMQPVFVMISPTLKLFPSLPYNPWPVQSLRIRSCPDAAALGQFIKTVIKPASTT